MNLKLEIYDASNSLKGHVKMELNYEQHTWLIKDDSQQTWGHVGFSEAGSFELKSWGVLWLWDEEHNTVIFWDAPNSETEFTANSGTARIFDPKDPAFKEGKINWTMETVDIQPLSELRKKAQKKLEEIIPAPYGSQNWLANPFHSMKPGPVPGYTNCVELPAYLGYLLGDERFPRGYPPATTKGWTNADGVLRPLPGDVFILCKGSQQDGSTAHVGIIFDTNWNNSQGLVWRTADWGQGDGWSGDWVDRIYDPTAGTLAGDNRNPRPPRAIKGWVNLDAYFA